MNGLSTSPFELVYGVKPDLRTLFRLFSCGYFLHDEDGTRSHDGIAESRTMQGTVIGRSHQADGMMFYSPATRQLYTSWMKVVTLQICLICNTTVVSSLVYMTPLLKPLLSQRTSQSSCEAEVKATDVCTKSVQMFRNLLSEIGGFDLTKPTPILNDNQGMVDWCKKTSTKGICHVNICNNCVWEAIHEFKEVQIFHLPGKHNPSDIFTKEIKDANAFVALHATLLSRSPSLQVLANGSLSRLDGGC